MTQIPGPRTYPTVKPLAHNNHKSLRSWQIVLGPFHMVILLGIITGCMAASFYLGFFSGQKFGIETALNNNISTAMRWPIEEKEDAAPQEDNEQALHEVYAKLNDSALGVPMADISEEKSKPNKKDYESGFEIGKESVGTSLQDATKSLGVLSEVKGQKDDKSSTNLSAHVRVLGGPILGGSVSEPPAYVLPNKDLPNKYLLNKGIQEKGENSLTTETAANQDTTLGSLLKQKEEERINIISKPKKPVTEKTVSEKLIAEKKIEAKLSPQNVQEQKQKTAQEDSPSSKLSSSKNKPPSISMKISSGWFAQIAAPRKQEEAQSLAAKLQHSGFRVVIEEARVRGEQYYRVLVGPEDNRPQAERLLDQLKRESYLSAEPFIRLVK